MQQKKLVLFLALQIGNGPKSSETAVGKRIEAFRQPLFYFFSKGFVSLICIIISEKSFFRIKSVFLLYFQFVMWWIYAILSALFAALTALFAKLGVENVNSNLATAIRTLVVLIMIWLIVFARNEAHGIGNLSKQNVFFLVISGIATGLSWIFYFKALQMGNVSQVASIDKLSLALTIIFAAVFLGETITLKTAIGAGLIIAGTLVLVLK